MRVLRRFPFALWAPVFLGSVFILNGAHPRVEPLQLGIGLALTVAPFALAVYLAIGPWRGRPGASLVHAWFLGGTAMFYVIISLAALVLLNGLYAVVCLLAGLWPMTAVALWIANSRNKTTGAGETPDDQSAADDAAMAPGIGAEDERPLGDTPEAHDEISPHDLPKGHPGRRAAERLAENREGATCGRAEGGAATSGLEFAAGAEQPETVTEEGTRRRPHQAIATRLSDRPSPDVPEVPPSRRSASP